MAIPLKKWLNQLINPVPPIRPIDFTQWDKLHVEFREDVARLQTMRKVLEYRSEMSPDLVDRFKMAENIIQKQAEETRRALIEEGKRVLPAEKDLSDELPGLQI